MSAPTALNSFVTSAGRLCITAVEGRNISSDVFMTTMADAWIMETGQIHVHSLLSGRPMLSRTTAMAGERDRCWARSGNK